MQPDLTAVSHGFPPIARRDARILVLGSLPSARSIEAGEYFAHPRNAFWQIIAELTGVAGAYRRRRAALIEHRIALWDVLAHSVRPGSLDSAIRPDTARPNDFSGFFRERPDIYRICFNGRTAEKLFRKLVWHDVCDAGMELRALPSTSPAYAAMSFEDKLAHWRDALNLG
jgi:double-stranded uracil-DNA glycosylase